MDEKFKQYHARLVKEGIIKSLLCALTAAFAVLAIATTVFWFTDFKAVWLGAVLFAATLAVVMPVTYFVFFRPNDKEVARRVDKEFGLDERILTMTEFQNVNSFMANAQRENATAALGSVGGKAIKVAVSVSLIVGAAVALTVGAATTTVSSLSAADIIPSGKELIAAATAQEPKYFEISYLVKDAKNGSVLGKTTQTVESGEDAAPVLASAQAGYVFVGWSDGYARPYREDKEVNGNIEVTALFESLNPEQDDPETDDVGLGDPESDGNGESGNAPSDPGDPSENGNDSNGDGSNGDPGDGAGGGNKSSDNVFDGKTNYGGSTFDNAQQESEERTSQEDIPEDEKKFDSDYLNGIKK